MLPKWSSKNCAERLLRHSNALACTSVYEIGLDWDTLLKNDNDYYGTQRWSAQVADSSSALCYASIATRILTACFTIVTAVCDIFIQMCWTPKATAWVIFIITAWKNRRAHEWKRWGAPQVNLVFLYFFPLIRRTLFKMQTELLSSRSARCWIFLADAFLPSDIRYDVMCVIG